LLVIFGIKEDLLTLITPNNNMIENSLILYLRFFGYYKPVTDSYAGINIKITKF